MVMQGPMSIPSFSPNMSSVSLFSNTSSSPSRPTTRDGSALPPPLSGSHLGTSAPNVLTKERKLSFSRKASLSGSRRRGSTSTAVSSNAVVTDAAAPPALPDYALSAAAKVIPHNARDTKSPVSPDAAPSSLSRSATLSSFMAPPTPSAVSGIISPTAWPTSEATSIHQQMFDLAHKRIATLDYLRKAHEGRIFWFTTYLFEKSDLARIPAYDPRKLARKATNLLLLGLSIPTINDLYSSTPLEFLRCLNSLFSEFDSFQQLHSDSANSLTRARLPNMFRRPGGKTRRSTSVADIGDDAQGLPLGGAASMPSFMNFAASESDLLPGEEYTYLLTPSLPFDPDFFETFSTLCDVLIDCYQRFLTLIPTSRECTAPVAELFSKADAKIKKLIVQGVIKDFEEQSRSNAKAEVLNIGKVVLGGLM